MKKKIKNTEGDRKTEEKNSSNKYEYKEKERE